MAIDEKLAARARAALADRADVEEKRMFGGLAFMVRGHMACGVVGDQLMVRVGPENHERALRLAHAHEMKFTGRPMRGFVVVDPKGVATLKSVAPWVRRGVEFVTSLPPKKGAHALTGREDR
ncbi:MAG: TfoX/Sxy family protein [Thermoanaerobaculia bacterium]